MGRDGIWNPWAFAYCFESHKKVLIHSIGFQRWIRRLISTSLELMVQ